MTIRDLAGDGDHYAAEVVSESFRGKSRVQQHQMVYDALKGNMGGALHALALQTSAAGVECNARRLARTGPSFAPHEVAVMASFRPIVGSVACRATAT